MERRCECGLRFANLFQLGPHRRFCVGAQRHATPAEAESEAGAEAESEAGAETESEAGAEAASEYLPQPFELARRAPGHESCYRSERIHLAGRPPVVRDLLFPYSRMQRVWEEYVVDTRDCCSPDYWKVYETVIDQPIRCRDEVLKRVQVVCRLVQLLCRHAFTCVLF